MAEVKLPKGILAISGRIGDYIFRTRNGKTHAYYRPRDKHESISSQSRDIIER